MVDRDKIRAACVVVGCKEEDLLHSRLRKETVVLIVGPVGYKHIVPFADLAAPPPVTTKVEAEEAPVAAAAAVKASAPVQRRNKKGTGRTKPN